MHYDGITYFIAFGKMFGVKTLLSFYFKNWNLSKRPMSLPIFGVISHKEEFLGIRDNILKGSLRDREMEKHIRKVTEPLIVDCGVNVGVTVRWWFHLNPKSIVYGIDMMSEATDFTVRTLQDRFKKQFVPITAVLGSSTGRVVELSYDDPLYGGNNAKISKGYSENRCVHSTTLDDCLRGYNIDTVDLLKVDIEDSAALMLQGATETLPKVKNIFLELHSKSERDNSIRLLSEKGFCVRRSYKRHVWLKKAAGN